MITTRTVRMSLRDLELLEVNARYMRHETYQTLVANIRRDGGLTSVPFAIRNPKTGRYKVYSGNHRVKAAIDAGVVEADVMLTDDELSRDHMLAIQLSHNAIVGEDDPAVLARLYQEIEDLDMRAYAGLDDKTLGLMAEVGVSSLAEANLEFQTIQVTFLPNELVEATRVWEACKTFLKGSDEAWLNRFTEYDKFLDTLQTARESFGVNNTATALMLLLHLAERHLSDLSSGWADDSDKRDRWVPIATIIGTDKIPVSAAHVIKQGIEKMVKADEVSKDATWQAIEFLFAQYLAGKP